MDLDLDVEQILADDTQMPAGAIVLAVAPEEQVAEEQPEAVILPEVELHIIATDQAMQEVPIQTGNTRKLTFVGMSEQRQNFIYALQCLYSIPDVENQAPVAEDADIPAPDVLPEDENIAQVGDAAEGADKGKIEFHMKWSRLISLFGIEAYVHSFSSVFITMGV